MTGSSDAFVADLRRAHRSFVTRQCSPSNTFAYLLFACSQSSGHLLNSPYPWRPAVLSPSPLPGLSEIIYAKKRID